MSVTVIDPNSIYTNKYNKNGIVDPHGELENLSNVALENLNIFVELKVTRRTRLLDTNHDEVTIINYMGYSETESTNNSKIFTTDWTENNENFGIKSINMEINASYVPQVEIVFEDVRGHSLFSKKGRTPYESLMTLPPPIFDLTLKGYYGQGVTYRLHLVNLNWEFLNTGSYEIRAKLVGMTFAPLSDILFDYMLVTPYMYNNLDDRDNLLKYITNTRTLINNIKTETKADENKITEIEIERQNLKTLLYSGEPFKVFLEKIENLKTISNELEIYPYPLTIDYSNRNGFSTNIFINKITENEYNTLRNKLVELLSDMETKFNDDIFTYDDPMEWGTFNLTQPSPITSVDTRLKVQILNIKFNTGTDGLKKYLENEISKKDKELKELRDLVDFSKNEIVNKSGVNMTLRELINILLKNAKLFYDRIYNVVKTVEQQNRVTPPNPLVGTENHKYAFPNFTSKDLRIGTNLDKVTNDNVYMTIPRGGLYDEWEEVKFVNEYIDAKLKSSRYVKNIIETINIDGTHTTTHYLPINSLDDERAYKNLTPIRLIESVIKRLINIRQNSYFFEKNSSRENVFNKIKNFLSFDNEIVDLVGGTKDMYDTIIKNEIDYIIHEILYQEGDKSSDLRTYITGNQLDLITINDIDKYMSPETINYDNKEGYMSLDYGNYREIINIEHSDIIIDKPKFNDSLGLNESLNLDSKYNGFTEDNLPMFIDKKYNINNDGTIIDNFTIEDFNPKDPSEYLSHNSLYKPLRTKDYTPNPLLLKIGVEEYDFSDFLKDFIDLKVVNIVTDRRVDFYDVLGNFSPVGYYAIPTVIICKWFYNREDYPFYIPEPIKNKLEEYVNNIKKEYVDDDVNGYWKEFITLAKNNIDTPTEESADIVANCNFIKEMFKITYITKNSYIQFTKPKTGDLFTITPEVYKNFQFYSKEEIVVFINDFIRKLKINVKDEFSEESRETAQMNSSIEHLEIKTQLYYNFKKFVDRWVVNAPDDIERMFDPNTYLTVDRGYNDIGDVVLDLSPLYEMEYNSDTSLYTLLLDILSKNNFEFFALPAFIDYNENNLWGNNPESINSIFGTQTNDKINTTPKYVCMYIGGTSSQLDLLNDNGYENDSGVLSSDLGETPNVVGLENTQVFRVDYGGGNQSFFYDIKADQSEYKETNESIRLLDELSKRGENPTVQAGNSLMGIYEQRSYTVSVTMMGCVMIQPTMYFELTMPTLRGTYLILNVNHIVENNRMKTVFKGVRIPKVPKPYVNSSVIQYNRQLNDPVYGNTRVDGNYNTSIRGKISNGDIIKYGAVTTKIEGNNIPIEIRAFMDVISYAEGTMLRGNNNGYDWINGSYYIDGWTDDTTKPHPFLNKTSPTGFSAAGRYQIQPNTWRDYWGRIKKLNPEIIPFSRENQDLFTYGKIMEGWKVNGNLNHKNITDTTFINYIDAVANIWAALPYTGTTPSSVRLKVSPQEHDKDYNWESGMSYYAHDKNGKRVSQLPKGKNTIPTLWEVYLSCYNEYKLIEDGFKKLSKENQNQVMKLHPSFRGKVTYFLNKIKHETEFNPVIFSGKRNNGEPDNSLHEFGLAIDVHLYSDKLNLNTNHRTNSEIRKKLTSKWRETGVPDIGKSLNLYWGGDFTTSFAYDNVHFEIMKTNGTRFTGTEVDNLMKAQGLSRSEYLKLDLSKYV